MQNLFSYCLGNGNGARKGRGEQRRRNKKDDTEGVREREERRGGRCSVYHGKYKRNNTCI